MRYVLHYGFVDKLHVGAISSDINTATRIEQSTATESPVTTEITTSVHETYSVNGRFRMNESRKRKRKYVMTDTTNCK